MHVFVTRLTFHDPLLYNIVKEFDWNCGGKMCGLSVRGLALRIDWYTAEQIHFNMGERGNPKYYVTSVVWTWCSRQTRPERFFPIEHFEMVKEISKQIIPYECFFSKVVAHTQSLYLLWLSTALCGLGDTHLGRKHSMLSAIFFFPLIQNGWPVCNKIAWSIMVW